MPSVLFELSNCTLTERNPLEQAVPATPATATTYHYLLVLCNTSCFRWKVLRKENFQRRTRHEEHLFTAADVMVLIALNTWSGDSHFYCESNVAQVEEIEFVFKQRLKKKLNFLYQKLRIWNQIYENHPPFSNMPTSKYITEGHIRIVLNFWYYVTF